jgi:hypothetical protein
MYKIIIITRTPKVNVFKRMRRRGFFQESTNVVTKDVPSLNAARFELGSAMEEFRLIDVTTIITETGSCFKIESW